MDNAKFNPVKFKAILSQDWDAAAEGWEKWWEVIEKGSRGVSERLLELARIKQGDKVLDIATGIGEPAVSAARRVGPKGRITAVDFSSGMLKAAGKRAKDLGVSNIDFFVMDGEELKMNESEFDAIVCRWGLMFFPDPVKALNIIRRLLKKGGHFAAAVWDVPEKVPMISLPMGVVRKELQLPPPPPEKPTPFSLANAVLFEGMLKEAGFNDVRTEAVKVTLELSSAEEYTNYVKDVAGPVVTLLKDQTVERQAHIWREVTEACRRFEVPSGGIRMENSAICAVGRN